MNAYLYWALEQLLKPAGGGVFVVSTGLKEQQALQKKIYQADHAQEIESLWKQALRKIPQIPYVFIGIPSDTGAGFTRGSNQAPLQLRKVLPQTHPLMDPQQCIDIGDIRVVPQLLDDEMLSYDQKNETHLALYGSTDLSEIPEFQVLKSTFPLLLDQNQLPVSPLSITHLLYQILFKLSPSTIPIALGGDHSVAWPTFKQCFEHHRYLGHTVGLLHFDAHTDLLEKRLGVKYCFATWAYHANECFDRDGRLIQVGVRASGKTQEHWQSVLNVRQYWPHEYINRDPKEIAHEIIAQFQSKGVTHLYISNDIDGTDMQYAYATGTPEGNGLTPYQVSTITQMMLAHFKLIGADIVEVAPPLEKSMIDADQTLHLAIEYLRDFFGVSEK